MRWNSGRLHGLIVSITLFTVASQAFAADPPPLEFRLVATPSDSSVSPRIPDEISEMTYRSSAEEQRPEFDSGFAWFPVRSEAMKQTSRPELITREAQDSNHEVLLADDPEFGLLWDGSWKVIECKLSESESGRGTEFEFQLDSVAGQRLREMTRNNLQRRMAVVVDGQVIVIPTIHAEIGATGVISSGLTMEEAKTLYRDLLSPAED